jgi:hypothetical protein
MAKDHPAERNNGLPTAASLSSSKREDNRGTVCKQEWEAHVFPKRDDADRQPIEGIFGGCKRRFGLKRLLPRLPQRLANTFAILMIVLNLETIMSALWQWLLKAQSLHQVGCMLLRLLRPMRGCG